MEKKHLLSILVDNTPGVLSRIAGLFSGRGYNIESLSVAETLDPFVSRMIIVTKATPAGVEQIIKLVGNHRFGQIFITDTHQNRLQDILSSNSIDYKLFKIAGNSVVEDKKEEGKTTK